MHKGALAHWPSGGIIGRPHRTCPAFCMTSATAAATAASASVLAAASGLAVSGVAAAKAPPMAPCSQTASRPLVGHFYESGGTFARRMSQAIRAQSNRLSMSQTS